MLDDVLKVLDQADHYDQGRGHWISTSEIRNIIEGTVTQERTRTS
jgi:hypothetical protein